MPSTPIGGGAPTTDKWVCFALRGQEFAVPIRAVKETIETRPLTRLFLVPPLVAGLINLRGEVVAVLDLGRLLNLPAPPSTAPSAVGDERRIVILRSTAGRGAGRAAAGLLVDRLGGVVDIAQSQVRPPPATVATEAASYLLGVAASADPPRTLLLLSLERVLGNERLRSFRRAEAAAT